MSIEKIWLSHTPEFVNRRIEYPTLEELSVQINNLKSHQEVISNFSIWEKCIEDLILLRWSWLNSVAPFNTEDSYIDEKIENISNTFEKIKNSNIFDSVFLDKIIHNIKTISNSNDSPLYDEMKSHLEPTHSICFIQTDPSSLSWLENYTRQNRKWVVKSPSQIRGDVFYDAIVIFGQATKLIKRRGFADKSVEFLLTSPRAKKIYWSHYKWTSIAVEPEISLVGSLPETKAINYNESMFLNMKDTSRSIFKDESLVPQVNEQKYLESINKLVSIENIDNVENIEEAHCYVLSKEESNKNYAAYVLHDEKATVVDDFDEDGTLDIEKVHPSQVGEGMYILKRMEGADRDVLEEIANSILGESMTVARQHQKNWRNSLKEKAQEISEEKVISDLKSLGISYVNKDTIKRWTTNAIKPKSSVHFNILLKYLDFDQQIPEIASSMDKIHSAHIEAGQKLDRLLREKINNLDVKNFSGKVQIDFDLLGENMGTLSAFRIEAKLNSLVKVPKSWGGWGIKEIYNA